MHRRARRRARLERHRLALREREHAFVPEPPGELGAPAARAIFPRYDESDSAAAVRDKRRPRERARARCSVGDREALAIAQAGGELAVTVAPFREYEDAAKSRARERDRASH